MLNLITKNPQSHQSILDEIARQGAVQMLVNALQREVSEYVADHASEVDSNGHRLVTRNGKGQPRKITFGSGQVEIQAPRVNDRRDGQKFTSMILPPYLRKSPNIESLLPVLYLRGLSTGDFREALSSILGEGARGLSPGSIVSLKRSWEKEFDDWRKLPVTERFVYVWADGVNVKIRIGEDKRLCLLVIVGVTETGEKRLLAVEPGYRESADSWKSVLKSLTDRGMQAPLLAVADGALGFWSALEDLKIFQDTKKGRCWVHKIANVLNCFPKRLQGQVKSLLHDMMYSETKSDANMSRKRFAHLYHEKYPKGVDKLEKDWRELTAFFDFPASHWQSIRTTNPIESTFATVKLRTKVTKGAGSEKAASAMAFKLLLEAQKKWRRIRKPEAAQDLLRGVVFRDGVVLHSLQNQEGVA
ncbi:IS256 family transposase [Candidatus Peregrinibacteria bacterium CG10_big_fil_rev_8_21_14_0_10_49_10]|nr:MAG: IS256 family transposase [Candidatus Peregrinibacteria bacterium CG10_big_fil_rev_8_21_14_0_10_49_10]